METNLNDAIRNIVSMLPEHEMTVLKAFLLGYLKSSEDHNK